MDGIIIVDKPKGPTSRSVAQIIGVLFKSKAGHVGTLDPKVTGVLPIFIGKATKLVDIMSESDKEYVGKMFLHKDVDEKALRIHMSAYTGTITQVPPVRSAVKRAPRKRKIYEFELLSKSRRVAEFRVRCEAGTYVRKLIHDMGQEIGGAHMVELRRTAAGPFTLKDAIPLKKVENDPLKYLRQVEVLKKFYKSAKLKKSSEYSVSHGSPIFENGVAESDEILKGEKFLILDHDGFVIGLGEYVGGKMFAKVKSILYTVSKSETKA